jgi:hypothetical protein
MSTMRAILLLGLYLAACSRAVPREPEAPPPPRPEVEAPPPEQPAPTPAAPGLPAEFTLRGVPEVQAPFLAPEAMWRFLVSRLTTLRADARADGEDILVTFERDAVHVTTRAGGRLTWRLPDRLRLERGPTHVLLGSDLTTTVYGPDGAQVPAAEEITVTSARLDEAGAKGEFRLVIKGGRGFQSISPSR